MAATYYANNCLVRTDAFVRSLNNSEIYSSLGVLWNIAKHVLPANRDKAQKPHVAKFRQPASYIHDTNSRVSEIVFSVT